MKERKRRIVVASVLFMLAVATIVLGNLALMRIHEKMVAESPWYKWAMCGECCLPDKCNCDSYAFPSPSKVDIMELAWWLTIIATTLLTMFFVTCGCTYYKYGHFCFNKKEEYTGKIGETNE